MRITRHLWAVFSLDGRVLHMGAELAVFLTRLEAQTWARNECVYRPQIKKLLVPEWWSKP